MDANTLSAIANVVTACGVVFAAGQVFSAERQKAGQLEIHVVELHTHFQQQMREIQRSFPPEVREPDWMPKTKGEERAVQMYWLLVFDEWYSCKYLSTERRLNDLWRRYRYGALSAAKKPAFAKVIETMLADEAIFFGLGGEFSAEIYAILAEARSLSGQERSCKNSPKKDELQEAAG